MMEELKKLVGQNEKILYEGKPNKKCFIFESIFNPLLPVAILWGIFDFGFIGAFMSGNGPTEGMAFFIGFFALHLMPVWIYLSGVLLSFKKYKNTNYIVTDSAIYISSGVVNKTFNTKPFAELSYINLHRGMFDRLFNVGDVVCTSNQFSADNKSGAIVIASIYNYLEVYGIVQKLQKDIYTDVMYPNDKRPDENHGYNTKYKG